MQGEFRRQLVTGTLSGEYMKQLLDSGELNVNVSEHGWSLLHYVAKLVDGPATKVLVDAKADVHKVDYIAATPLHNAALNKQAYNIRILLEAQADVNAVTKAKSTPLHFAANGGSVPVLELLINAQADVYALNDKNETPLQVAARWKQTDAEAFLQACQK